MGEVRVGGRHLHGSPARKVVKVTALVIMGIVGAAALAIVFGLVIQWLWNELMPAIFGLPEVSYWQAVGLVVLAHILFGGHHHSSNGHSSKKKMVCKEAEPEGDSAQYSMEWSSFREFWRDSGREAFSAWLHGREDCGE